VVICVQYFRIYSPVTFGQKYDKSGKYIRRFLPVLKGGSPPCSAQPRPGTPVLEACYSFLLARHLVCRLPGPPVLGAAGGRGPLPHSASLHELVALTLGRLVQISRRSTSTSHGRPRWRCSRRRGASLGWTTRGPVSAARRCPCRGALLAASSVHPSRSVARNPRRVSACL
jgi:hypothetical protein